MRNLKKLLAVIVTIAMIATFAIPAFAETKTDSAIVTDLGMLKGEGAGVTDEYLATQPDRLQAAIMFLRLLGKEAEALAFTGTETFADADQVAWAGGKAVLAYLHAHPELGYEGIGNNMFDPATKMTAKAYYKVMLVALGHAYGTDFTWDNVLAFASTQGLSKNLDVDTFTVNDLAVATVEALKATPKGGTDTLIADLVADGTVAEAAAVESGLYAAAVVELAVESVMAHNMIEVMVAFNQAVDEETAETVANYSIEGITIESATLAADGKTVTLVLDDLTLLSNGDDYTLEVADDLVETSVDFTAVDETLPVAQSIELTGPDTFEITFSEPIDSESEVTVEVEDGIFDADAVADDTNVVAVTLGSELSAGDYKVVVSGAKDFSEHPQLKKTFTLKYVKDETAPVPTLVSSEQTKVVIDFGKVVDNGDGDELDESFFYHSYTAYQPNDVSWDGSEVTLTFTDYPLPEGNVKIVVIYDADGTITDLWGNEMTADAVLTGEVEADNVKPTITKVEVTDEDVVEIYFDDTMDEESAETEANYVVEQDGEEIDNEFTATLGGDDNNIVTLDFAEDLDGAYTIDVADVTDDAYVPNTIADVTVSFTVKDITGIDLNDITVEAVDGDSNDTLIVRFPDTMAGSGTYSALSKGNYLIDFQDDEGFVSLDSADTLAFFNGNDTVKITIADQDRADVETDGIQVMVARLADSDGNVSPLLGATIDVEAADAPAIAQNDEDVDIVEMTGYKTVDVTFDSVITTAPANGFKVSDDGGLTSDYVASVKLSTNDDGNTVATLTLKADQQLASGDTSFEEGDVIVYIQAGKIKADTGMYAEAATAEATDVMAPVFDSIIGVSAALDGEVDANDTGIVVTFSEEIADTDFAAFDLVVKNADGDELVAGTDYTAGIADGELVILIAEDEEVDVIGYTVESKASIHYLKDASANKASVFTAQEVEEVEE